MTLMETLYKMRDEVQENPDDALDGTTFLAMFRTDSQDIIEFQESNKRAARAMARIGGPDMALDGLVQTCLTVGYMLAQSHAAEDAAQTDPPEQSEAEELDEEQPTHETRV